MILTPPDAVYNGTNVPGVIIGASTCGCGAERGLIDTSIESTATTRDDTIVVIDVRVATAPTSVMLSTVISIPIYLICNASVWMPSFHSWTRKKLSAALAPSMTSRFYSAHFRSFTFADCQSL